MTRLTKLLLVSAGLLLVGLWPTEAMAQCNVFVAGTSPTCMQRTTLSANVAADDAVINVTSATGFTAGNGVWIGVEELEIVSITGTAIRVSRGQNGTRAMVHDNTDAVLTGVDTGGPRGGGHFNVVDPNFQEDCTRGTGEASHLPWINVRTGWVWSCDVATDWTATNVGVRTLNSEPADF